MRRLDFKLNSTCLWRISFQYIIKFWAILNLKSFNKIFMPGAGTLSSYSFHGYRVQEVHFDPRIWRIWHISGPVPVVIMESAVPRRTRMKRFIKVGRSSYLFICYLGIIGYTNRRGYAAICRVIQIIQKVCTPYTIKGTK